MRAGPFPARVQVDVLAPHSTPAAGEWEAGPRTTGRMDVIRRLIRRPRDRTARSAWRSVAQDAWLVALVSPQIRNQRVAPIVDCSPTAGETADVRPWRVPEMVLKRLCLLIVLLAVLGNADCALSAVPSGDEAEAAITVDLRDTPLEDALRAIFKGAPYQYRLEVESAGRNVTLTLNNVTFSQALRAQCLTWWI